MRAVMLAAVLALAGCAGAGADLGLGYVRAEFVSGRHWSVGPVTVFTWHFRAPGER